MGLPLHDKVFFFALDPICLVSLIISSYSVVGHLRAEGSDHAHALTVRILLMVPVYSLVANVTLLGRFTTFAQVLHAFEKFYECVVLFSFLQLLVLYLGGIRSCCQTMTRDDCHHILPVTWFLPVDSWAPPQRFVRRSLGSCVTYVPVMLCCFVVTCLGYFFAPEGTFRFLTAVCGGVVFFSTFVAMYGLVVFYHANMDRLAPTRPLMKLASIKLLVMISAWQEIGVRVAANFGGFDACLRRSRSRYTVGEFSEAVVAALLVVEMLVLSLAHLCIWPVREPLYDAPSCGPPPTASDGDAAPPEASGDDAAPPEASDGDAALPEASGGDTATPDARTKRWGGGPCRRRLCLVVGLHDTLNFYRELQRQAPSPSTDDLVERPTCCKLLSWTCCRYLQGTYADADESGQSSTSESETSTAE